MPRPPSFRRVAADGYWLAVWAIVGSVVLAKVPILGHALELLADLVDAVGSPP